MTRLPLALAALWIALMATIASAQSYPQPYSMYGPGLMPQTPYGYGPVQQAAYGYGQMPSGSMYPSLPAGPMYSGAGYPSGAYPGAYAPGMMPQGMYGPMPQNPAAMQSPAANQGARPTQSSQGPQEYHGPQPQIAKASPPPMKLPPGVKSENGLLYYNGSPTADVNFQQFPTNNSSRSPNHLASYEPGAENGAGPGSTPSVMNPGANSGNGMPAGNAMAYGGQMSPGGDQGCNQCQDNDESCGSCSWLCPYTWFYGLCHGSAFPGKLGYVWNGGYDNLAMTRNSGTDRTLLKLDNGDGTFTPIFNSNDLGFNWDYGGRAHLELIGPSGITYQAEYTRIATFVTQPTVFGDNNLTLPGSISSFSGFNDVDQATFYYSSAIQTGELNMIFPFGSFEFLTGYRYMQVDEKAQIATVDSDVGNSFFDANSLNRMNGGQIGVLGRWEMFGLFDFDFDAKFAVMGNAARIQQNAFDPVDTTIGDATGTKTRVAYVTELGLQGVIPLSPSFSFHAGYNVFFIDGVALAPDQFDFNLGSSTDAGTQVHNHGDIVLQGVNAGITAVW